MKNRTDIDTPEAKLYSHFSEVYDYWQARQAVAEEDMRMTAGDQWEPENANRLRKQKRPVLSMNFLLKYVSIMTGYEQQNRTDAVARPVEKSDQDAAEIHSALLKYIFATNNSDYNVSAAFQNTVITGLGWVYVDLDYENDFVEGDIRLYSKNPFRVLPDMDFTQLDLSDCAYVYTYGYFTPARLKTFYPKYANAIDEVRPGNRDDFVSREQSPRPEEDERLLVIEKWYKTSVKKTFLVDTMDGSVQEFEGTRKEKKEIERLIKLANNVETNSELDAYRNLEFIERYVNEVELTTLIEDQLIVYDGPHPHGLNRFPIFPIPGYFLPDFDDLVWKFMGIVRPNKDRQKETNKRKSQILGTVMRTIFSGWKFETGAVVNPADLQQSGSGKNIEVAPGKMDAVRPIDPAVISPGLVQLEQLSQNEKYEFGFNAEMMGNPSGSDVSGLLAHQRQRQGIMAVQNFYTHLAIAKQNISKYIIDLVNENWTVEKISRITGKELPPDFEHRRDTARYDFIVDERANSPTFRMANFQILAELTKAGLLPPLPHAIIEASELPRETKEMYLKFLSQMTPQPQ